MAHTISEVNPSTTTQIGTCPDLTPTDTTNAITAAQKAFQTYRHTPVHTRAHHLRTWHSLLLTHKTDLATLLTLENGKPYAEALAEITYAASFLAWFAEEAPRTYGDTIPVSVPGTMVLTVREPVGVCGLITPWNFPAAMVARKIGPALAAGCSVVVKSAAETPFTANAMVELASRAGIPDGVVNVVTAGVNTVGVGRVLASHDDVRKVSFTGSTGVGKVLMGLAAGGMKRGSWELGGIAPFIVGGGQTCVCANRVYVQRGVYGEFAERLVERIKGLRVGDGFGEGVTIEPLIHGRAVEKVMAHVEDAKAKRARVLFGGRRMEELGPNFVQPTVLVDMTGDMRLASEETFGPVAALFPFDSEEEVIREANRCEVGLAAYIYTGSTSRLFRVAEALEVGMVGANTGIISNVAAPFGGVKESGFGREGSKYGIDEFYSHQNYYDWGSRIVSPPRNKNLTTQCLD
ncbi:succinate semialdehyde dehydrogenase [Aspergillus alliaceus]|uniref:succinate-semialdehyde dehydrogenase [NAD(P)(+)] n=1 Tax=Petromyces alliaceus TaxID=209559 RepID=A0A5N7C1F5_PETAA|nr:succinate semialdehyde dehydrogenase [Aspergillus alliaceus]